MLIAPWLFVLCLMILFSMLLDQPQFIISLDYDTRLSILIAISIIMTVICISWFLMHIASCEKQEQSFEKMLLLSIDLKIEFVIKCIIVWFFALISSLIVIACNYIFIKPFNDFYLYAVIFITFFFMNISVVAVGVLCSYISSKTVANYLLFNIIFFPLITPILLCSSQVIRAVGQSKNYLAIFESPWFFTLIALDLAFVAGSLIFVDILKE